MNQKNIDTIYEAIPDPALYEQLSEECAELCHAALKVARILRRENPTPVSLEEAFNNMLEEVSDVQLCMTVLALEPKQKIIEQKMQRWVDRIEGWKRKNEL